MTTRIRFYEWLAGKLLVRSARLRHKRMGPDDAHEIRHLFAAITAGNSDPCDGGSDCHLDAEALVQLGRSIDVAHYRASLG